MSKKKITVQSAKAKGRSLQQWACRKISDLLSLPWGKDELIASREGGQAGTDVRLIGDAIERFPFAVECKWQERWSVPQWVEQARSNQTEGTDWLVIAKRNYHDPVVIMDGDAFFELLKKTRMYEKPNLHYITEDVKTSLQQFLAMNSHQEQIPTQIVQDFLKDIISSL